MEEKKGVGGLSAFSLKIIALVLMTVDHIGEFIPGTPYVLRMIGRLSAPIFFFIAANSLRYTSNRTKFVIRLYIFSMAMELIKMVVWAIDNTAFVSNNIFGTLFYVALLVSGIEGFLDSYKKKDNRALTVFALMIAVPVIWTLVVETLLFGRFSTLTAWTIRAIAPTLNQVEGGIEWILLGIGFFYFGKEKKSLALFYGIYCAIIFLVAVLEAGAASLFTYNIQWMMVFALPLLLLYNHKRGPGMKWFFYIYYILHIWILFVIGQYFM